MNTFASIFLFYGIITHFLIIKDEFLDLNKNHFYLHYYTSQPVVEFFNIKIYGSLFFKLKSMALILSDTNNYIFFNGTNFKEMSVIYSEYDKGIYPHSEYFSSIANLGILGLLSYLLFMYYPLILKNYAYNKEVLPYLIITSIFLIEALIADTLHLQFLWLILLGNINLKSKMH